MKFVVTCVDMMFRKSERYLNTSYIMMTRAPQKCSLEVSVVTKICGVDILIFAQRIWT